MIKSFFKKNLITVLLLLSFIFIAPPYLSAQENLAARLSGKILLEVQSRGEAWYINPSDLKKYYLGRPSDAFSIMKFLGQGITNNNLNKIGADKNFTMQNLGKIFLQTENHGEAWYVNPAGGKKYFLGRPADAFNIMRKFGLGITNDNLNKIITGSVALNPINDNSDKDKPTPPTAETDIIYSAATAIRAKNKNLTASYFIPEMKKSIDYNLDNMSNESILALGNILSGSKLTSSTDTEKIYTNDVYFSLGGYDVPLSFHVKKQPDGSWLIANL